MVVVIVRTVDVLDVVVVAVDNFVVFFVVVLFILNVIGIFDLLVYVKPRASVLNGFHMSQNVVAVYRVAELRSCKFIDLAVRLLAQVYILTCRSVRAR